MTWSQILESAVRPSSLFWQRTSPPLALPASLQLPSSPLPWLQSSLHQQSWSQYARSSAGTQQSGSIFLTRGAAPAAAQLAMQGWTAY